MGTLPDGIIWTCEDNFCTNPEHMQTSFASDRIVLEHDKATVEVPWHLVHDDTLGMKALCVWLTIRHFEAPDGTCRPAHATLAKLAQMSERDVAKRIEALLEAGYLSLCGLDYELHSLPTREEGK